MTQVETYVDRGDVGNQACVCQVVLPAGVGRWRVQGLGAASEGCARPRNPGNWLRGVCFLLGASIFLLFGLPLPPRAEWRSG